MHNHEKNRGDYNYDQTEIDKFNALASRWWDINGEFKSLHRINPLRVDYILQHVECIHHQTVIDVGCGGGILAESLAKIGATVSALDLAPDSLQAAKQHAIQQGLSINYYCQPVERFAEEHPEQFDIVTCMEMLEHVPNPQSVIRACVKLVKPGGKLFFSTINRNTKAWFMLIIGAEYIAQMVPKGTHNAQKFIRPSELMNWLDGEKATTKQIVGITYNMLKNEFKLSNNTDVNYLLCAIK